MNIKTASTTLTLATVLMAFASGCDFSSTESFDGEIDRGFSVTQAGVRKDFVAGSIRVGLKEETDSNSSLLLISQGSFSAKILLKVPFKTLGSDDLKLSEKETGTDFGIRSSIRRENIKKNYKTTRSCTCDAMIRFEEYLDWVKPSYGGPQWSKEFDRTMLVSGKYSTGLFDANFIRENYKIELLKGERVFTTFTATRDLLDDSRSYYVPTNPSECITPKSIRRIDQQDSKHRAREVYKEHCTFL